MQITIFSIGMTILWSSILILVFYVLRKKSVLLEACSVSGVLLLYIFCAVRLMIPIELPWTKEVFGGEIYNRIYDVVRYEVVSGVNIQIYQMFYLIWMAGAFFFLVRFAVQYKKMAKVMDRIPVVKDESRRHSNDCLEGQRKKTGDLENLCHKDSMLHGCAS